MAGHPYGEHRAHHHAKHRVAHIAHMHDGHGHRQHRATGGAVHGDEAEDRALIRKEVKGEALKHHDGKKAAHRADKPRRAAGGKILKGHAGHPDGIHIPHRAHKHHAHKHAHHSALHVHEVDGHNTPHGKTMKARARGGHVKGHHKGSKTNVNVIVAPRGGQPPMAGVGGMPPPAAAAPPPMPPRPLPAPAPASPMMGAPGPGGMPVPPVRSYGGRAYKKGGSVKPAEDYPEGKVMREYESERRFERARGGHVHDKMIPKKHALQHDVSHKVTHHKGEPINTSGREFMKGARTMRARGGSVAADVGVTGIGDRTPIQHSGNKSDTQNIGRGPVITRKTGGPIFADGREGKQMGPNLHAGANSGIGRRRKAHLQSAAGHEPWDGA